MNRVQSKPLRAVSRIKDFNVALKDMEPLVKNPAFLRIGREFQNFSLRPREAWANWLICVVLRKLHGDAITFSEDASGDGFIIDERFGVAIPTEHVSALELLPEVKKDMLKGEARIIEAINKKIAEGFDYANGKYLVVFFDGAGIWYRDKVREAINGRHNFNRKTPPPPPLRGKRGKSFL